ncbi:hypothetical protein MSAN_02500400 [Mycena sanguinolenta]|uniref:Uncharacterized protein n=1 Tax=Mycena sanguinolenta TaxID=230812 RepID=A0A8H6WU31_9AGAR|nr:hypothetical protein MSAN_02500400 [Mycena sanguinolenta]
MDDHSGPLAEIPSYTGAFFPNSRHLVVEGGTFTSHSTIASPPADYLRIPLGSIDLRNEIRLDSASCVVFRDHTQRHIRRMYAARVECRSAPMTVALYEGDHAEEEWKNSVSVHSRLRHPHILQIYAAASASGLHATVFHDDLIPPDQSLESFGDSIILQIYIQAYSSVDVNNVWKYCGRPFPDSKAFATLWFRRSTGRVCIELGVTMEMGSNMCFTQEVETLTPPDSVRALRDSNQEAWVIASLSFHQWYTLCDNCLSQFGSYTEISVQAQVKLNSIMHWPSGFHFEDAKEIGWEAPAPVRKLMRWNSESYGLLKEDGSVSEFQGTTLAMYSASGYRRST